MPDNAFFPSLMLYFALAQYNLQHTKFCPMFPCAVFQPYGNEWQKEFLHRKLQTYVRPSMHHTWHESLPALSALLLLTQFCVFDTLQSIHCHHNAWHSHGAVLPVLPGGDHIHIAWPKPYRYRKRSDNVHNAWDQA